MKATDPADHGDKTARARLKAFKAVLVKERIKADSYLTREKTLSADLLVSLVHNGLLTLKHYIEDPQAEASKRPIGMENFCIIYYPL